MKYILLLTIVFFAISCNENKNIKQTKTERKEVKKDVYKTFNSTSTSEYNRTKITPITEIEINNNENLIYCSSFKIAWDRLNNLFEKPLKLDTNINWVNILNKTPKDSSVDDKYLTAMAGFGKTDIVQKINSELNKKFGVSYQPNFELMEDDILSFSYLRKDIRFSARLDIIYPKMIFNNKDKVSQFGLEHSFHKYRSILIHNYRNKDDFIIELKATNKNEGVYLAKIKPGESLKATYDNVFKRINLKETDTLERFDKLFIPYIKYDIKKEYYELYGRTFEKDSVEKYTTKRAIQIIDFDLNKNGISIKSLVEITEEAVAEDVKSREYIFDKPFLIILKEKDKQSPYFLMWVGNSELMIKPTHNKR